MRIIFVRHGEPDYEKDCLTETGRQQAAAAAERLAGEGISEIYASPCGRARETAEWTARRLGLPVTVLDYMHEISWGGEGVPEEGHPWTLGDQLIAGEDFDFYHQNWREHPFFRGNSALMYETLIAGKIDHFLQSQGYRHEGSRFFCEKENDHTVAIFSHGGSGACALSHLLTLPFPYVCSVMPYDFTSIIVLRFASLPGTWVFPRIELFNDCAHIQPRAEGPALQQKPDRAASAP
ncbi:MAG: histidine phosphatase family protein [Clostridia bacterium]|nr:histidine phosphatase family protein [Clostridia bacterium]